MGDHHIGREMGLKAEAALAKRRPGATALDMLDRICEPHRGRDAEFESEDPRVPGNVHPEFDNYTDPHPKAALGMLMLEAFAPGGVAAMDRYDGMGSDDPDEDEAATDRWFAEVYEPFRERYGFC
jgi:hypothetical protein